MARSLLDKIKILLVEDNPGDARLAIVALRLAEFDCIVDHVVDGVEALDRLHANVHEDNRINLVLMDINMPRMNGRETLDRIKSSDTLKNTHVVMMSTSNSENDISFCHNHGADAFLTKPADLDDFVDQIKSLKSYVLTILHSHGVAEPSRA